MRPGYEDNSFKFIGNRHRESPARSLSYFIFFLALIPSEIILLFVGLFWFGACLYQQNKERVFAFLPLYLRSLSGTRQTQIDPLNEFCSNSMPQEGSLSIPPTGLRLPQLNQRETHSHDSMPSSNSTPAHIFSPAGDSCIVYRGDRRLAGIVVHLSVYICLKVEGKTVAANLLSLIVKTPHQVNKESGTHQQLHNFTS